MNQQFSPEFIDRIVQEVIRRLAERGVGVGETTGQNESELVLDSKLVTLATLDGRLTGLNRLVVNGRAVVTPAVQDELREKSIELIRK